MDLNLYDEFWFKVKIQSAKGVYGVECQIVYPPDILEAVLAEDGAVKTQMGSFLSQNNSLTMLNARLEDDKPGKIFIGLSKLGEAMESAGAGSLFDVLFRCIGVGQGDIRFAQSQIYDAAIKTKPSQWTAVSVQVVGINIVSVDLVPRSIVRREIAVTLQV
ncbi:hypothetical protein HUU05_20690 [candidate division KSB1 bacterium]|nr:hypothetical protein [candidate division KSB1 bacterium]